MGIVLAFHFFDIFYREKAKKEDIERERDGGELSNRVPDNRSEICTPTPASVLAPAPT